LTVHKLDDVYENRRSIWMTVAANRRRFRHRIHAGGIFHGRNRMLRRRREVVFRAYCETKLQAERRFAEETTYLGRFCR